MSNFKILSGILSTSHQTLRWFLAVPTALCLVLLSISAIADVTELGNDALEQLRSKGVAIIDVRRIDEWQETGIIQGSHPITFFDAKGGYDAQAWLAALDKVVQPDQPVVLICAHGVRSSKIAALLDKRLNYRAVHNVTGGIYKWLDEKRPVVQWTSP